MSEYTPGTPIVRAFYVGDSEGNPIPGREEEFDRWLAGVRAEAKAEGASEALKEAAGDMNARINAPELIKAADRYAGYYAGMRTAVQQEEARLLARAKQYREEP